MLDGVYTPVEMDAKIGMAQAHIKFCVEPNSEHFSYKAGKYSKVFTCNVDIIQEYKIVIDFDNDIELSNLDNIIDNIMKFVCFFNFDLNPYVRKIDVIVGNKNISYFKNDINYNEKYIKKSNYLSNCKLECIRNMIEKIGNKKYDIGFIKLLNTDIITINDIWILSKSIEAIVNETCIDTKTDEEIKFFNNLKKITKKEIEKFEKDNFKIENARKNLIYSIIEIPPFRGKVSTLLKNYNKFIKPYSCRFKLLNDEKINEYSRIISKIRNSIHGNDFVINDIEMSVINLILFSLYLYILDDFGCEDKFNLIQNMFR